jgi:hypothetical protein
MEPVGLLTIIALLAVPCTLFLCCVGKLLSSVGKFLSNLISRWLATPNADAKSPEEAATAADATAAAAAGAGAERAAVEAGAGAAAAAPGSKKLQRRFTLLRKKRLSPLRKKWRKRARSKKAAARAEAVAKQKLVEPVLMLENILSKANPWETNNNDEWDHFLQKSAIIFGPPPTNLLQQPLALQHRTYNADL